MIKLFRFLLGYVEFEFINGFSEGFINECFEKEILIQNITLCENGFNAICRISTYKKLHIALKNGGGVLKKHGCLFSSPLKNEQALFWALLFVLFLVLGSFIWNVEIKGCDTSAKPQFQLILKITNSKAELWGAVTENLLLGI
ncbi:MAG: sporulation protein YqfD [Eubacterium sp.]